MKHKENVEMTVYGSLYSSYYKNGVWTSYIMVNGKETKIE